MIESSTYWFFDMIVISEERSIGYALARARWVPKTSRFAINDY